MGAQFKFAIEGNRFVIYRYSIKHETWLIEKSYASIVVQNWKDVHVDNETRQSIMWTVGDFEDRASSLEEHAQYRNNLKIRPTLYIREKFSDALLLMAKKHDGGIGISWDTIDMYLNEMCKYLPEWSKIKK